MNEMLNPTTTTRVDDHGMGLQKARNSKAALTSSIETNPSAPASDMREEERREQTPDEKRSADEVFDDESPDYEVDI
jgi:hypothetical protein